MNEKERLEFELKVGRDLRLGNAENEDPIPKDKNKRVSWSATMIHAATGGAFRIFNDRESKKTKAFVSCPNGVVTKYYECDGDSWKLEIATPIGGQKETSDYLTDEANSILNGHWKNPNALALENLFPDDTKVIFVDTKGEKRVLVRGTDDYRLVSTYLPAAVNALATTKDYFSFAGAQTKREVIFSKQAAKEKS